MSRKISRSFINGRTGAGTGGQGLKVEWDSTNDGELHWKDVSESSLEYVVPWVFQGSNYGFTSGGFNGSSSLNEIDKFSLSSNVTAADHGNLTVAKRVNAASSSSTDGFASGGEGGKSRAQAYKRLQQSEGKGTKSLVGQLGKSMASVEEWYSGEQSRLKSEKQRLTHEKSVVEAQAKSAKKSGLMGAVGAGLGAAVSIFG